MAADPGAVEQAVSRTLRDNLEKIQRSSEELHQAVSDLVSACASNRPANALPPMIRAQACAASLSAVLEVLSRFVTSAMQPSTRSLLEQEISRATSLIAAELATPVVQPEPAHAHLTGHSQWTAPAPVEESPAVAEMPLVSETPAAEMPSIAEAPAISDAVVAEGLAISSVNAAPWLLNALSISV